MKVVGATMSPQIPGAPGDIAGRRACIAWFSIYIKQSEMSDRGILSQLIRRLVGDV